MIFVVVSPLDFIQRIEKIRVSTKIQKNDEVMAYFVNIMVGQEIMLDILGMFEYDAVMKDI